MEKLAAIGHTEIGRWGSTWRPVAAPPPANFGGDQLIGFHFDCFFFNGQVELILRRLPNENLPLEWKLSCQVPQLNQFQRRVN